jgi:hypothetical protein
MRRESSGTYSESTPQDETNRKRPYSSISGEALPTPTSNRHAAWAADVRAAPPRQTPPIARQYSAEGIAPRPAGLTADEIDTLGNQYAKEIQNAPAPDLPKAPFNVVVTEASFQGCVRICDASCQSKTQFTDDATDI